MPALSEVWLDDNALGGGALGGLARHAAALPALEKLHMYSNDMHEADFMAPLTECLGGGGWPELKLLTIGHNPGVTDEGQKSIAQMIKAPAVADAAGGVGGAMECRAAGVARTMRASGGTGEGAAGTQVDTPTGRDQM